jgi:hypothetical protein
LKAASNGLAYCCNTLVPSVPGKDVLGLMSISCFVDHR